MELNDVHPSNMGASVYLTALYSIGMVNDVRPVQLLNAPLPMSASTDVMDREVNLSTPSNACAPTAVILEPTESASMLIPLQP